MIDYEKLRLAHTLVQKIHLAKLIHYHSEHDGDEYFLSFPGDTKLESWSYTEVDDLITKLQSLLVEQKPEPKYKVGDTVWFNECDSPYDFIIDEVIWHESGIYLYDDKEERELYPSREALIQSQIKHWQGLSVEKPELTAFELARKTEECDHDFGSIDEGMLAKDLVCIKCHEFPFKGHIVETACNHESDGNVTALLCNPPIYNFRCKHCGEFYK